jgi:hypothetical protein
MAAGCGMVQVASKVRKRRYSRRLASARYPQIPVALPGAAGKRRQGPVSSDRTPWLFVWHKICAEYDGPAAESPQQNRPHAVLLDVGVAAPSPREGAPFSLH